MEQCSPHAWRTPVVGDEALVCDVCESRLDLVREYRRYNGPIVGGHFEEALEAALAAARGARLGCQSRLIGGGEHVA